MENKGRLKAYFYILCVVFIVLTMRLFYLQIINGEYYAQQAESVFSRVSTEKSPRGEILARNHEKLATSKQAFYITYTDNRKKVSEKEMPLVLLKTIRLIKTSTNDYDKLKLDTVPIKVRGSEVSFNFLPEDFDIENNENKEKILETAKKKENRFKKDYNIPVEYDAKQTLFELLAKYKIAEKDGDNYKLLNEMSLQEAKDVLSLRLLIDKNKYTKFKPVSIANNVSKQTAFLIASKSEEYPNVSFIEEPMRYYPNGDFATHVIGSLTRISEDKATQYKDLGYDINADLIGGYGLEAAFENILTNDLNLSLHGQPKEKYITVDKMGNQVKLIGEVEGVPGDTIVTTIDYNLQKVAEESLNKLLQDLQSGKADGTPRPFANRGAVVVVDVRNGEVLALASKPSYDPNLFAEFGTIKDEETRLKIFMPGDFLTESQKNLLKYYDIIARPLYNYATRAAVPPGSTFKLFTSIVGLEEGIITPNTIIYDKGQYREGEFSNLKQGLSCWIWNEKHSNHGPVNVAKALQVSCNYFYYSVSHRLGWDKFTKWLENYGLINGMNSNSIKTGIEIRETPNTASNPQKLKASALIKSMAEIKKKLKLSEEDKLYIDIKNMFVDEKLDKERLKGLTENQIKIIENVFNNFKEESERTYELLNASIGQGKTQLTPLQMAQFYMTVLNGGNRYKLHLVKEILNPDGTVRTKIEPEVISKVEIKQETYNAVIEGLKKVTEEGTAAGVLKNYPISNGGKTGTAQAISGLEEKLIKQLRSQGLYANGWYVGFAPIENPEIVVVCLVFNSDHGSSSAKVVKDIYDEYFGLNKQNQNQQQTQQ